MGCNCGSGKKREYEVYSPDGKVLKTTNSQVSAIREAKSAGNGARWRAKKS